MGKEFRGSALVGSPRPAGITVNVNKNSLHTFSMFFFKGGYNCCLTKDMYNCSSYTWDRIPEL